MYNKDSSWSRLTAITEQPTDVKREEVLAKENFGKGVKS